MKYTNNIMPIMNNDNDHNIKLTCSSIYSEKYRPFGLFDNNFENSGGRSFATQNGVPYGWLKIEFPKEINISKYTMTSRKGGGRFDGEMPNKWWLYGSNNNKFENEGLLNEDYFLLDYRDNQTDWGIEEKRNFEFMNFKSFRYYKFNFKGLDNGSWICIDNMEFMSLLFFAKYLIKSNEKYYSLKDEYYDKDNHLYKPLDIDKSNIENIVQYGFEDISSLYKKIKIGDDYVDVKNLFKNITAIFHIIRKNKINGDIL